MRLALVLLHLCEHHGGLGATHDADVCVGPHEEEVGAVRAAAHAVVARPEAAPDDERHLRHLRAAKVGALITLPEEQQELLPSLRRGPSLR
eukprot:TRINITY_DN56944_c0_g1_i1.p4 TRINITY_DN56944_c0_g1~~TRINITY_DN56944_c0_g1_i1.p4  ORF type:complete len:105 (+),score=17.13 TRINITY_DN56944_c0_g1_i1:44-316(+)